MCNTPFYYWDEVDEEHITLYLAEQANILQYNNPDYNRDDVKAVIEQRLIHWKGNNVVREHCNGSDLLETALNWYYNQERDIYPLMDLRKTWYSDAIEELKGMEKSKAKAKARHNRAAQEYRQEIDESSRNYQYENFNVLPTIKHLDSELAMSRNTIKKHGYGLYVGTVENKKGIIRNARRDNPAATQQEIADLLGLSRDTVNKHWKVA